MSALIATRTLLAAAAASRGLAALATVGDVMRREPPSTGRPRASARTMPATVARLRLYIAAHAGTGEIVTARSAVRFATNGASTHPHAFLTNATEWLPELYECDRGCLWLAGVHDDPTAAREVGR